MGILESVSVERFVYCEISSAQLVAVHSKKILLTGSSVLSYVNNCADPQTKANEKLRKRIE
jgi:hypothetical protein